MEWKGPHSKGSLPPSCFLRDLEDRRGTGGRGEDWRGSERTGEERSGEDSTAKAFYRLHVFCEF